MYEILVLIVLLFPVGCGFGLAVLVKHELEKRSSFPEKVASGESDDVLDMIKASGIAGDLNFASPAAVTPQPSVEEPISEPESSVSTQGTNAMEDLMDEDDHDDVVSRAMSSLAETENDDPNYDNLMNSVKKMAGEMDLTPSVTVQSDEPVEEKTSEMLDKDHDFDALAQTVQEPTEVKPIQEPSKRKLWEEYKPIPVFSDVPQGLLEVYDCFEQPNVSHGNLETVQEITANTPPELLMCYEIDGVQTDEKHTLTADTIVPLRTRKKARAV